MDYDVYQRMKAPESGAYYNPTSEATTVMVTASTVGDINGDGNINTADRILLSRYLADWNLSEEEKQYISLADINNDGKISQADRIILSRYLAGWDGYAEYFK